MVKPSTKESKETEKQKLLNRENRTSGSSSSGSKSSSGSAGKGDGSSDHLNNVEMSMSVLMATIDQIMRRLEKIDLSKVSGGGGAPASSMGPSEHGGLHFPKSLYGDDAEDGDDNVDAAYPRRYEKSSKNRDEDEVKQPKRRNTFSSFSAKQETNEEDDDEAKMDDDEPIKVILVESDAWMINPTKKFRMTWDLCLIMPFLVYLTVMMPFRLCFANEPRFGTGLYWFEFMIDIIFILDIFTNFRTGVFVGRDGDGDTVEYDRLIVAKQYLKSWCVLPPYVHAQHGALSALPSCIVLVAYLLIHACLLSGFASLAPCFFEQGLSSTSCPAFRSSSSSSFSQLTAPMGAAGCSKR